MVIVTRILGTSFMDYPGRQRTRKEEFWFCHQYSSLQSYTVLVIDNTEDGRCRIVDATGALTKIQ